MAKFQTALRRIMGVGLLGLGLMDAAMGQAAGPIKVLKPAAL